MERFERCHARVSRVSRVALVALACVGLVAIGMVGCGDQGETPPPADPAAEKVDQTPLDEAHLKYETSELRFAGVDLVYALRRVAGEAGLLLVVDEIRPRATGWNDLGYETIDADIPAGPAEQAVRTLRSAVSGAFEYEFDDGILFVRSVKTTGEQEILDRKILPAAELEADLLGLIRWLNDHAEGAHLRSGDILAGQGEKRGTFTVPETSSVIDALKIFARATQQNVHLRRAGFAYTDSTVAVEEGQQVIVTSTIGLLPPLPEPRPVPSERPMASSLYALASISERMDVPICVYDRAAIGLDIRGSLAFRPGADMGKGDSPEDALRIVRMQIGEKATPFEWERHDGILIVKSYAFDFFLTGKDLLREKVNGGTFEGSLGELVRWLNRNRKDPSEKLLTGGELTDRQKVTRIEIEDGSTIDQVLRQFARASGECWNLVVRDSANPEEPLTTTWAGVQVTPTLEWGPSGAAPDG